MLRGFSFRFSRLLLAFFLATVGVGLHAKHPRHLAHELPENNGGTPTATASENSAGAATPAVYGATKLPPLPKDVEELKFSEFFRQPVGPRGLELSERLRQLDGHRVRILGYMVDQSQPAPRCLLLAPLPVKLHEDEWGFSEDLPATVMHVFVDPNGPEVVPFTPGPLLLTGILHIGNHVEPDQRISIVRLQLDAPEPASAPDVTTKKSVGTVLPERDLARR